MSQNNNTTTQSSATVVNDGLIMPAAAVLFRQPQDSCWEKLLYRTEKPATKYMKTSRLKCFSVPLLRKVYTVI